MSAVNAVVQELEQRLRCPLCMKSLSQPRRLPCLHTVCSACLEPRLVTTPGEEGCTSLVCPVCEEKVSPLSDGLASIPYSYYHSGLGDVLTKLKTLMDQETCSPCSENGKQTNGELLCLDCVKILCDQCCKTHQALLADHQTLNRADVTHDHIKEKLLSSRKQYCATHPDKPLEFFCQDCNHLVCIACSVVAHSPHTTVDLDTVSQSRRKRLESGSDLLAKLASRLEVKLTQVDLSKDRIRNSLDISAEKVKQDAQMLYAIIQEYETNALKSFEEAKEKVVSGLVATGDDLQQKRKKVLEFNDQVSQVLVDGTGLDVTHTCTLVEHKIKDMLLTYNAECKKELQKLTICPTPAFKEPNMQELLPVEGVVKQQKEFEVVLPWSNLIAVSTMGQSTSVCGVQKVNEDSAGGLVKIEKIDEKLVPQMKQLVTVREEDAKNKWVTSAAEVHFHAIDTCCTEGNIFVLYKKTVANARSSLLNVYGVDGTLYKSLAVNISHPGGLAVSGEKIYISSVDDSTVYQCEVKPDETVEPTNQGGAWLFKSIYNTVASVVTQHAFTERFLRIDRPRKMAAGAGMVAVSKNNGFVVVHNEEAQKMWAHTCLWPHSLSIDKEGRVLVAFYGTTNNTIEILSRQGSLLGQIVINRDPEVVSPFCIASAADDRVLVVDNNKLMKYSYEILS